MRAGGWGVVGCMWRRGGGRGAGGFRGPVQQQRGWHAQPCLQVGELGAAQHLQDAAGGQAPVEDLGSVTLGGRLIQTWRAVRLFAEVRGHNNSFQKGSHNVGETLWYQVFEQLQPIPMNQTCQCVWWWASSHVSSSSQFHRDVSPHSAPCLSVQT